MVVNIAIFGSVDGALKNFFTKVQKILVKQEFSFAIVLGDLFPETPNESQAKEINDLLNGVLKVPLATYFGIGTQSLPSQVVDKFEALGEFCNNLFFLGKRRTLRTSEGVTIAALGGNLSEISSLSQFDPTFTIKDAHVLWGTQTADILVTNQWPQGVQTGSKHRLPRDVEPHAEAGCVSDLCSRLKPKYHFAPSAVYYSREPFFHSPTEEEPDVTRVTRFEAIAPFNNSRKEKWFYAFKFDPLAPPPTVLPVDVTGAPFNRSQKRRALAGQNESYSRYTNGTNDAWQRPKRPRRNDYTKLENCFFCIGSPMLQTHLITSMADESYLTVPRGPLPPPGWNSDLGIPCHILIIPHTHVGGQAPIDQRAHLSSKEYEEMQRYRGALCRMLQAKGNGKYGGLCWETSRSHIRHVHWQFVPIPFNLIGDGLVEAGFKVAAEKAELPPFKRYEATTSVAEAGDYFRLWIWTPMRAGTVPGLERSGGDEDENEGGEEMSMVMRIPSSERFDIQFGRKVTAQLVGLGNRADWHDVVQTEAEEKADAEAFKSAFAEYDPAMEISTEV